MVYLPWAEGPKPSSARQVLSIQGKQLPRNLLRVGESNSRLPKTATTRRAKPLHHRGSLRLGSGKYMSTIQGESKFSPSPAALLLPKPPARCHNPPSMMMMTTPPRRHDTDMEFNWQHRPWHPGPGMTMPPPPPPRQRRDDDNDPAAMALANHHCHDNDGIPAVTLQWHQQHHPCGAWHNDATTTATTTTTTPP